MTSVPVVRTVTLSPGYDDHFIVTGVEWGGVGTVVDYHSVPAGKGVNLARTASWLGASAWAYALVGEPDAADFGARLDAEGIPHALVAVPEHTRHNLTLTIAGTGQTAAHTVGRRLRRVTPEHVAALRERLVADVRPGDVVTLNGALPDVLPTDTWAGFVRALDGRGVRILLDLHDEPLLAALGAGRAYAAKPNEEEVLVLPGVTADVDPRRRAVAALRVLAGYGVVMPLVTLGAHGVAHLRDGRPVVSSVPVGGPDIRVVGGGGAFLAGVAAAVAAGRDDDAVALGLAAATAHVRGLGREGLDAFVREVMPRVMTTPLG